MIALLVAGGMALFGAISYVFIMGSVEKDLITRGAGTNALRGSTAVPEGIG